MPVAKVLHGVTYNIPETKEKAWGPTVTALLAQITDDLESLLTLISGVPQIVLTTTSTTLTAGATLTKTHPWHRLAGSPGAVTLGSIADGSTDGELLLLTGSANSVTVLDGFNTLMNGNCTLGTGDALALAWNAPGSQWEELWRNS